MNRNYDNLLNLICDLSLSCHMIYLFQFLFPLAECVEAFVMVFPGFFRFHFIWYDLRDARCSTNLEFISLGSTIKPSTSTKIHFL